MTQKQSERDSVLICASVFILSIVGDKGWRDMPVFLENSPENLYAPFTGAPFQWDTQDKSLYFTYIEDDETIHRNMYYEN